MRRGMAIYIVQTAAEVSIAVFSYQPIVSFSSVSAKMWIRPPLVLLLPRLFSVVILIIGLSLLIWETASIPTLLASTNASI
jgi:hypothetical protein